jgi:hypothetical protein
MHTRWLRHRLAYDGSQLRPHWILRATGLAGDALVAFRGPCHVAPAEIADLADRDGPGIAGADMVHFVWEAFDDGDLVRAVLRQRLLAGRARETLQRLSPRRAARLVRDGDDLWLGRRKLSISVATRSMVSSLIHFAVNVGRAGAPVPICGLDDLAVPAARFARELLARTAREEASIAAARAKVRAREEAGA